MKKSFLIAAVSLITATSCLEEKSIEVCLSDDNITYEGGKLLAYVRSNSSWSIVSDNPDIILSHKEGNGDKDVIITVPANTSEEEKTFTITFSTESPEQATAVVEIHQSLPELLYGTEKYKIKLMKDGRWWMVENLRMIPEGKTVSDNPDDGNGIWYPFSVENQTVIKDEEGIIKKGYLYNILTTFGIDRITEENCATFEGQRGLCPEGWHIPTQAEADELVKAYYSEEQKGAYIPLLEEDGFNMELGGFLLKNSIDMEGSYHKTSIGQIMLSTKASLDLENGRSFHKAIVPTINTKYNRITITNSSSYAGQSIRCIKDLNTQN